MRRQVPQCERNSAARGRFLSASLDCPVQIPIPGLSPRFLPVGDTSARTERNSRIAHVPTDLDPTKTSHIPSKTSLIVCACGGDVGLLHFCGHVRGIPE